MRKKQDEAKVSLEFGTIEVADGDRGVKEEIDVPSPQALDVKLDVHVCEREREENNRVSCCAASREMDEKPKKRTDRPRG